MLHEPLLNSNGNNQVIQERECIRTQERETMKINSIIKIVITTVALGLAFPTVADEQSKIGLWETILKDKYFKGVDITEGEAVIELKTPYRAEDAATVPISINSKVPQTAESYIEKIYVFVEENPQPLVAVFTLTPDMGKADLAMRIRVDKYTNVRAIAKLSNGEYHMDTNFLKAQGGCSAPAQGDLKAMMKARGKMKFRLLKDDDFEDDLRLGQFIVKHPNMTGLQLDQRTRAFIPENYIKKIRISYNGKQILMAETGISVSQDPSFRFFFKPVDGGGKMAAEVMSSNDEDWQKNFDIKI